MPPPPRVTVLLPVRDGEPYLVEALDSILGQTYDDFELLVIDDGSVDRTAEILSRCDDARMVRRRHERSAGLVATLNEGLAVARGEYVARFDADDIAHPRRLERQIRYLDANHDIAAVGSGVRNFGEVSNSWTVKTHPSAVRARLVFECAIAHPSAVLRAEALRRFGVRYDPAYPHAEDWWLWVELAERARVANLPQKLLRYRTHARQVSRIQHAAQAQSVRRIYAVQLARLGVEASSGDIDLHRQISCGVFDASPEFLDRADAWLGKLAGAARSLRPADARAFLAEVGFRWARVCRRSRRLGLLAWSRFRASPLCRHSPRSTAAQVALGAVSCALTAGGRHERRPIAPPVDR